MEAVGATASVVGIVSFGLSLAKTLQAFIDSVIEAEETITLVVAEVNATASTLKRLQDFIDLDKSASQEQHRPTVLNATGIKEISACALQCEKVYLQIIILIEKASVQAGEEGSGNIGSQSPAVDDPDTPAIRLAVFSKNVNKLARKMRWPWLEPRIKRCQEHLGRLKVSLMLSLQVFLIAESRVRPPVARILGTEGEGELRDRAEMLRKKMTELRAKESSSKQSNRQPPSSDDGERVIDAVTRSRNVAITSLNSTRTTESPYSGSYTRSLDSGRGHNLRRSPQSRKSLQSRKFRVRRALRAFKVHIRKRIENKAVFKKDSTSVVYEAYLVCPFPGPLPGVDSSPSPMKLPFGHRRLTREIKRALRKCNPWDILLILGPQQRALVDRVFQQVQLAAIGNTDVCLVAIDIDGYSHDGVSGLEAGELVWTRMVLFFRHEVVRALKKTTEDKTDRTGGRPRIAATIHNILPSRQRKNRQQLELQEKLKREEEEMSKVEAKNLADKESIEKDRAVLEEAKKTLEAERIRIEEAKNATESSYRKLKYAEESAMKDTGKGTSEEELKKILEEERAKMKASEEKAAAGKAKPPLKFRDAVDRKFNFPFHLVQTWEGMEDLIKQAFLHMEVIGPHVREGHYDLIGSEGEVILPSFWSDTIKPGDSVSMRMWPAKEAPRPPQPALPYPGGPMQGISPSTDRNHAVGRAKAASGTAAVAGLVKPVEPPRTPPRWALSPSPPPGGSATWADIADEGPIRMERKRESTNAGWSKREIFRSLIGRRPKHRHYKPNSMESSVVGLSDEDSEDVDKGKGVGDIDKELGLDDLEGTEQVVGKDIDELLEKWTNVGGEI